MSGVDDPRQILRAAGVERAEVDDYEHSVKQMSEYSRYREITGLADGAILALALLAVEYKWAAESLQTELLQAALDHDFSIPTLAARLAQWEADHAT